MQGLKGPLLQSQVLGAVEGVAVPGVVSRDPGAHSSASSASAVPSPTVPLPAR